MLLHEASQSTPEYFFFLLNPPLSSQGEECPPPPPVSWSHVSGLQASLLGHLKSFVKSLDNPVQKESSLAVIPAYLAYLEAYYHQLSRQVLLPPVYFLPVCSARVDIYWLWLNVIKNVRVAVRSKDILLS